MDGPKEILLILHLPPPIHGAALMGSNIKESELINSNFRCNYINISSASSLKEIGKVSMSKLLTLLSIYWKVLRMLIISKPIFCYVTINSKGTAFYKDFGIVLLLKLFRKTIIYHFHNKGVSQYQNRFIDNILYRITFRKTYTILTSPFLLPDLSKYVSRNSVFFCPNGIMVTNTKRKNHNDSGPCRLLFISNMMKAKGVIDLIEAIELVKKRGLEIECDFVGKWFDVDEYTFEALVQQKDLSKCVHAHGAQYGSDRDRFYKNADIFVFPSHDEAFPLVLLEAMQYELPVISTDVAAIPEIVENEITGLVFPKKDIINLANKIETLVDNPDKRKEMGFNGFKKFHEYYNIDKFENNIKDIFDKIVLTKTH